MLEAVNSTLQAATYVRATAERVSSSDSVAANPERVQRSARPAPYLSPFIFVDSSNSQVVLQIRNNETGDAISQFPSQFFSTSIDRQSVQQPQQSSQPQGSAGVELYVQAQQAAQVQQQQQVAISTPVQSQQLAAFQTAAASGGAPAPNGVSVLA